MAETATYTFDLREVAIALIKKQGLTEGRWMIGFEFQFTGTNFGTTMEDAKPVAIVQVNRLQLVRVGDDAPASGLVISASEVNPAARKPANKPTSKAPARR